MASSVIRRNIKVLQREITTNSTGDFNINEIVDKNRIIGIISVSNNNNQICISGNGWVSVRTKDGCTSVGRVTLTVNIYYL